jgi:hypothetical protein
MNSSFLADPRAKGLIVAIVAGVLTLFAVPESKQDVVLTIVGSVYGLFLVSVGYQKGKEVEGTIPEGRKSSASPVNVIVNGATEIVPADVAPPSAPVPPGEVDPNATRVGTPLVAILLLASVVGLGLGGCTTSRPFREGASVVGTRLANNAGRYVTADATISTEVKADREANVVALREATSDEENVAYEVVARVWPPVKLFYLPYIESDPRFANGAAPDIKKSKLWTVQVMDGLVAAEQTRRLVLGLFGDDQVEKAAAAATQPVGP